MEPLKIHYYRERPDEGGWHAYVTSRDEFTLTELKEAPIVPMPAEPKMARHTKKTITFPPFHRVRQNEDGTLMDEDVFPYGWVKPGVGKKGNQGASPLLPIGQGFSATFNRKVYGHLLEQYPPETSITRNRKTSEARDKELESADLDPHEIHTLQQRYQAFLLREKELGQKNRTE